MITFIIPWKNCFLNERNEVSRNFLKEMEEHMSKNLMLQTIICDYGSEDNIKEEIKKYKRLEYLYIEPNEGEFLNQSKCFNRAIVFAKNPIIAPMGTDFSFSQNLIEQLITLYRVLGRSIIRPELIYMDKNNKIINKQNVPYSCLKEDILKSRGWDERMYDWGKEEDDLIVRLRKRHNLLEVCVKGMGYIHRWHDRSFSEKEEESQGNNYDIFVDNLRNNGKNVLNTTWKLKEDVK